MISLARMAHQGRFKLENRNETQRAGRIERTGIWFGIIRRRRKTATAGRGGRANQGRTADGTIEANASADYKFSEQIRTSVFGSYEMTYKELTNGTTANGTTLGQKVQDVYYMGGANTVVAVIPSKSDVTAGYQYHRGRTRVDGSLVEPLPITGLDAYTKHAVDGNITYKVTRNFKGKLGYIFEQLNYTDPRYDRYTYYSRDTTNTGNNYAYTGAFADNSFTAHVGYLALEYAL